MIIKPLKDRVVLRPAEATQESRIGLIISSQVTNEGTVVAIGPEVKEVRLGDRVRVDMNDVVKLEPYWMCRESFVLCVIE